MSATNAFESALLSLILTNADAANIGDATGLRGSSTAGVVWISLHESDPGEGGDQESNETDYTDYERVSVVRSTAGWTVSGDSVTNDGAITFPVCGASGATITHFGIGTDVSGAGNLLLIGTCSLVVSTGVTPAFAAGALTVSLA